MAPTWSPPLRGKVGALVGVRKINCLCLVSNCLFSRLLLAVNPVTAWLTMEEATTSNQTLLITLRLRQRIQLIVSKRERKKRNRVASPAEGLAKMDPPSLVWPSPIALLLPAQKEPWTRCNQCPAPIPSSRAETLASSASTIPPIAHLLRFPKLTLPLRKTFATRNGGCLVFQTPLKK